MTMTRPYLPRLVPRRTFLTTRKSAEMSSGKERSAGLFDRHHLRRGVVARHPHPVRGGTGPWLALNLNRFTREYGHVVVAVLDRQDLVTLGCGGEFGALEESDLLGRVVQADGHAIVTRRLGRGHVERHPWHGVEPGHVRPAHLLELERGIFARIANVVELLRLPIHVLGDHFSGPVEQLCAYEEDTRITGEPRQRQGLRRSPGRHVDIACAAIVAHPALQIIDTHPDRQTSLPSWCLVDYGDVG